MINERDFDEHDYYNIFVLGNDLLRNLLDKCKEKATDLVFETCKDIYKWYLSTDYSKTYTKPEYDCLQEFVDNNKIGIVMHLYNDLGFPIIEWQRENGYIKD